MGGLAGAASLALAMGHVGCGSPGQATVVAPIFEHGEGRGSVGCVIVSPPVFLSEEDALQAINEELSRTPLRLQSGTWSEVRIPQGAEDPWTWVQKQLGVTNALLVDGMDPERRVAFTYVGADRNAELGIDREWGSSVSYVDIKGAARRVARQVSGHKRGGFRFGVFYDPMVEARFHQCAPPASQSQPTSAPAEPAARRAEDGFLPGRAGDLGPFGRCHRVAVAEAQGLLRQQVQDFVQWLKAQGAI